MTLHLGMPVQSFKSLAMLYDEIAVVHMGGGLAELRAMKPSRASAFEALLYGNFIYEVHLPSQHEIEKSPSLAADIERYHRAWNLLRDVLPEPGGSKEIDVKGEVNKIVEMSFDPAVALARLAASSLRQNKAADAYSVFELSSHGVPYSPSVEKSQVYSLLLSNMPIPSAETPWEDVLAFRNDDASREKLIKLRRWVAEVVSSEMALPDIEVMLCDMISDYRKHLDLHRIKHNPGLFETVVRGGVGLLEDLIKFNATNLANRVFSHKKKAIALQEAERSHEGFALSYLLHSNERFGK